ncbi:hypothetical protein ABIA26_006336 [Sinorhizobium fredii]
MLNFFWEEVDEFENFPAGHVRRQSLWQAWPKQRP